MEGADEAVHGNAGGEGESVKDKIAVRMDRPFGDLSVYSQNVAFET